MAKIYDLVVIGAGPASLLAAKAAGENGLDVALLERKPNIVQLNSACGKLREGNGGVFFTSI